MESEIPIQLLKKAGALLSRRAYSRGEMRARLGKAAEEFQVEMVLDHLEQLNLLNDADYAYNFALSRIKQKGWSPAKVQASLLRRHIAQASIEAAIERTRDEVGEFQALKEYLEKYCGRRGVPADPKDIRKLIMHLRQHGFDDDSIHHALKRIVPAADMRRFETGE
jgi:regulatory protein